MTLFRYRWHSLSVMLMLLIFCCSTTVIGQGENEISFNVFRCTYNVTTNTADIYYALNGNDGYPLATNMYSIDIVASNTGQSVTASAPHETFMNRQPVRIVIVLDVTNTMPIRQVVDAIATYLVPSLAVGDEVAVIKVGSTVSPVTAFYTDKNGLINDHLFDVETQGGDNRIFDGVRDAIAQMSPNANQRQIVLLLTDSQRRDTPQSPINIIISRAQATGTQVDVIGFRTAGDQPDAAELRQLAERTEGYAWLSLEGSTTPNAIENAVGNYLQIFAASLDSETILTVNMQGQIPDEALHVVPLVLRLQTQDGLTAMAQALCPIQILNYTISFTNIVNGDLVSDPLEVEVEVASDSATDTMQIAFWLDDTIVQNSLASVFRVDPSLLSPGAHQIRAQLRDAGGNVLASTQTVKLFAQHQIIINTRNGITENLSGDVVLEAVHTANLSSPPIRWLVSNPQNPEQRFLLDQTLAQPTGRTTLTIPDIYTKLESFFPVPLQSVSIQAEIPANTGQEPPLAVSQPLVITLHPPEPIPILLWISLAAVVVFLAIITALLRMIRQAQALRLIGAEDGIKLPEDMMAITVRNGEYLENYPLIRPTYTIGRADSNDIRLKNDDRISREHGVILWRNGRWYYTNRKRQIHTRINDKRYSAVRLKVLKPGTRLKIGDFELIFHPSKEALDSTNLAKTQL